MKGKLLVVSGPSGVGKGTICDRAVARLHNTMLSVSVTERPPRAIETGGRSYHFLTPDEFDMLVDNDGLLEWAVYGGNRYGTPKADVMYALADGNNVILEIDVQGGEKVKAQIPETIRVFIAPPNEEALLERLHKRGTESEEQILARIERARGEMKHTKDYDYVIVNDNLNKAIDEFVKIIEEDF
jgi:guanylate kinase